MGREGTGTLNVLAGASVETLSLSVARHGTGTVNVSGAGSHLLVSSDHGSYSNYANHAGTVSFGARTPGATGTLNITAGGVIDIIGAASEENPQLRFGRDLGTIGVGTIDGAGSELNIIQTAPSAYYVGPRLLVGIQGDGTLTVRNAGAVNVTGDNAQLIVSMAGSNYGPPPSSILPQSELIIQTGSVVTVDQQGYGANTITIGDHEFSNGAIRITGAGSKLVSEGVRDEIVVGRAGTGLLTIGSGGAVDSQRMFLGYHAGSAGTVQITGVGSNLTLTGDAAYDPVLNAQLFIATRGDATMTVSNNATVTLTGGGSRISVGDGNLADGYSSSTGTLTIQSGANVTVNNSDDPNGQGAVVLGANALGDGTILVTGAGSTLTAAGNNPTMFVGDHGTGHLNVTNAGQVASLSMVVGGQYGSHGALRGKLPVLARRSCCRMTRTPVVTWAIHTGDASLLATIQIRMAWSTSPPAVSSRYVIPRMKIPPV